MRTLFFYARMNADNRAVRVMKLQETRLKQEEI